MKITLAQLRKLGACPDEVAIFEKLFGESVEVTEALCVKHAEKFDWDWAAKRLLTKTQLDEYERIEAQAFARAAAIEEAKT